MSRPGLKGYAAHTAKPFSRTVIQRMELYRLVCLASPAVLVILSCTLFAAAVMPSFVAVAAGAFVDAATGGGDIVAATSVFVLAVCVGPSLNPLQTGLTLHVRSTIEDRVRSLVRTASVSVRDRRRHESDAFHHLLHRSSALSAGGGSRTVGAAAVGQLIVSKRYISSASAAAILTMQNPFLGALIGLVAIVGRFVVRSQWLEYLRLNDATRHLHNERLYYSQLLTSAQSAREVRVFGLRKWIERRRAQSAEDRSQALKAALRTILRGQPILLGCVGIGALTLVVTTAWWLATGSISGGDVSKLILAGLAVYGLIFMGAEAHDIEFAVDAVAAFRTLRTRGVRSAFKPIKALPASDENALRIERLSFWRDDKRILRNVSLSCDAGSVVALVGPNGAGKTTLINVLTGVYAVDRGAIRYRGESQSLDRAWRSQFALVGKMRSSIRELFSRTSHSARQNRPSRERWRAVH